MKLDLSICFPTFNRAELLEQALTAVLSQLSIATVARVEIVISNNASTDNTKETVLRVRHQWPDARFVYVEQSPSVGADNVYLVTDYAQGEFVLIVSDDDILLPGAIDEIFAIIDTNPRVDAISLNIAPFRDSLERLHPPVLIRERGKLTGDPNELLLNLGTMITFLSALVYRRALVAQTDYRFARNRNLIQSYAFVDVLCRGTLFYLSQPAFIAYRDDNSGGWDYFKVYVDNFMGLLKYAEQKGIRHTTVERVREQHLKVFLRHAIVHFRLRGRFGTIEAGRLDALARLF